MTERKVASRRVSTSSAPVAAHESSAATETPAKAVVKGKGRKAIVRKAGAVRRGDQPIRNGALDAEPANGGAGSVVRRRPKAAAAPSEGGSEGRSGARAPVLEVNPKLESTRGRLPKAQGQTGGAKPMTFAERQRAEAEAIFQQIAPNWKEWKEDSTPAPAKTNGTKHSFHKSEFELRVSERDSLTTALRLESDRKKALALARKLADQFQLPPDQGILTKIVALKDERLTLLAFEELLELDDRGRVRRNDELVKVIKGAKGRNPEIAELRSLLLEKLGVQKP